MHGTKTTTWRGWSDARHCRRSPGARSNPADPRQDQCRHRGNAPAPEPGGDQVAGLAGLAVALRAGLLSFLSLCTLPLLQMLGSIPLQPGRDAALVCAEVN